MKNTSPRKKFVRACTSTALGLSLALPLAAFPAAQALDLSKATPTVTNPATSKVSGNLKDASGQVAVFVTFKGSGAFEATQPANVRQGKSEPVKATAQAQSIEKAVESQAAQVSDQANSEVLYTTHNTVRGVALQGDAQALRDLAGRSDVEHIARIIPKKRSNGGTVIDTKAIDTWTQTGHTGKDVKVAVIDSGLDYTHADFGGPGTDEAYKAAKASKDMPAADSKLYDPEKFVGGYDLAGDDYDAEQADKAPQPDSNPLDCELGGHGTHVAGTTAGYGVNADGTTFKGDYTKLTAEQVKDMKIGPGSAPEAQLMSFRVFGCEGSTNLTGQALDMALDPNGDGDFSDRADIVNLSLGSDFGSVDDPENAIVDALYRNGTLSVIAAGNANGYNGEGDTYNILGTPGNTISSLTVANSIGSYAYGDKAKILAPKGLGDVVGDYSANFDYGSATEDQLTGEIVMTTPENPYACDAYPDGTDFAGKWVFIDWSDETGDFPCGSKVRFDHIEAAGGKGVVLASQVKLEDSGIAGNTTIPGVRINSDSAEKVREAVKQGGAKIQLNADWQSTVAVETGARDTLNPSTSRGQHGSQGFTKPDVAAPGTSIKSAGVAGGSDPAVMTGTSMASPHVAGVAALVLEAHRDYSPANIKAAIMNTANHDLVDDEGDVFSVERVGSGRIDALAAINDDVFLYNSDRPEQVSTSFGVAEVAHGDTTTLTRKVTVENRGDNARTFEVKLADSSSLEGVSISAPSSVSVGAHSSTEITLTATIDGSKLAKQLDASTEEKQLDEARQYISTVSSRLILTDGGLQLRTPVQIAPKPVSDMKVEDSKINFATDEEVAKVKLAGSSLNQNGYVSALGAFQLGIESPRIPTGKLPIPSAQAADLQYAGANSTIPAQRAAGVKDQPAFVNFGLTSWGNWDTVNPNFGYEIDIDIDNDGQADFFAITSRVTGLDYPIVELHKRNAEGKFDIVDLQPLNGSFGDIDTNTMDSNAMVLPVQYDKLGITDEQAQNFRYKVFSSSWAQQGDFEGTDWVSYNPVNPELAFGADKNVNGSLFVDAPETSLVAFGNSQHDTKALFLHMHNATGDLSGIHAGEDGAKAQVVGVGKTSVIKIQDARFTDVPKDYVFYNEISWLASRGITTGWSDGTFRPAASVERGQMAAFFYRMAGSPQYTPPATSPFKDVPTDYVFYKEIAWMHSQGIANGWDDGTFRPAASVERGQMAAFFYRMAGSPQYTPPATSPFKDVPTDYVFYKEIAWMHSQGIANGWDDGTYRPSASIERGQMAAFIFRFDQQVLNNK